MSPSRKPYKPGHWVFLGFVFGSFLGLLFDKLALGMIFGLFIGAMIDSSKRKAASASEDKSADDERST